MKIYLIIINIIAFVIFFLDKHKAKKHLYRIPERVLLIISFLGGSVGSLLGMIIFHHKTKKRKFQICIPLSLILWILFLL